MDYKFQQTKGNIELMQQNKKKKKKKRKKTDHRNKIYGITRVANPR